jgi:hypothetical protein
MWSPCGRGDLRTRGYVECIRDPEVQRFATDPLALTAEDVAAAISALADHPERVAYLVADSASGQRLGNIALSHTEASVTSRTGSRPLLVAGRRHSRARALDDGGVRLPGTAGAAAVDARGEHSLPTGRRARRLPPRPCTRPAPRHQGRDLAHRRLRTPAVRAALHDRASSGRPANSTSTSHRRGAWLRTRGCTHHLILLPH